MAGMLQTRIAMISLLFLHHHRNGDRFQFGVNGRFHVVKAGFLDRAASFEVPLVHVPCEVAKKDKSASDRLLIDGEVPGGPSLRKARTQKKSELIIQVGLLLA